MLRVLLFFLAFWLCSTGVCAQATAAQADSFYALFTEARFTTLSLYSVPRHPGDFPKGTTYLYAGVKVDRRMAAAVLKDVLIPLDVDMTSSEYYATIRYPLAPGKEALLLREFHDGGYEHVIHCVVFDTKNKKAIQAIPLTNAYGYEGGEGEKQSWITDLNQDGVPDIVSRGWMQYRYTDMADEFVVTTYDSTSLHIWTGKQYTRVPVIDSALLSALAKDFPYYQTSSLTYPATELIFKTIADTLPKAVNDAWAVVLSSSKDVKQVEKAAADIGNTKAITDYRYPGQPYYYTEIVQKGKTYYLLCPHMQTRNEAELERDRVKGLYPIQGDIVYMKEWCKTKTHLPDGYPLCR